ncbi:MAG TPA: hypothetical protein VGK73_26160 [Polyangiaceae bacterium]
MSAPRDFEKNPSLDALVDWVKDEPCYRRFEVIFDGDPGDHEDEAARPAWRVRVWSQKRDGTPRRPVGEGRSDCLQRAIHRALDYHYEKAQPLLRSV